MKNKKRAIIPPFEGGRGMLTSSQSFEFDKK